MKAGWVGGSAGLTGGGRGRADGLGWLAWYKGSALGVGR